jgi:hypothetical protein
LRDPVGMRRCAGKHRAVDPGERRRDRRQYAGMRGAKREQGGMIAHFRAVHTNLRHAIIFSLQEQADPQPKSHFRTIGGSEAFGRLGCGAALSRPVDAPTRGRIGRGRSMSHVGSLPRVAAIATMASRQETFEKVLPVIRAQVDHVFIYLDGYVAAPAFLEDLERITVRHAEAVGDLHCSSRFLFLRELTGPAVVVIVDDDIVYPQDYVTVLTKTLQRLSGQAIVGVHGRTFLPPHRSYVRDAFTQHFMAGLKQPCHVHELGVGTCAFVSDRLPVDPREWARNDMDDIIVATEAQKRGLPRVAVPRPAGWLKPYAQGQSDSLWNRTQRDDTEQSRLMRALLGLYG